MPRRQHTVHKETHLLDPAPSKRMSAASGREQKMSNRDNLERTRSSKHHFIPTALYSKEIHMPARTFHSNNLITTLTIFECRTDAGVDAEQRNRQWSQHFRRRWWTMQWQHTSAEEELECRTVACRWCEADSIPRRRKMDAIYVRQPCYSLYSEEIRM